MFLPLLHEAGPRSEPSERPPPSPGSIDLAIFAGALLVSFGLMPMLYDLVAFGGRLEPALDGRVLRHLLFNCAANCVIIVGAAKLRGRLDQKLTRVVRLVAMAYGLLALITLVTRQYYSIPMLLTGSALSVVLGAGAMFACHKASRPKAAVLGPWHPVLGRSGVRCERIDNPRADTGPYDPLIVTFAEGLSSEWAAVLADALLAGKRVRHAAEYVEELEGVVSIEHFEPAHLPQGGLQSYRTGKRLLELAVLVMALPLVLPLLIGAALAVLIVMGRPVFFVQQRIGLAGRAFDMFKLRTMRPASASEAIATAKGDGRITPLGKWLRRFHLDELPQIWNVLVGDMSLVGPRPEQPSLARAYIGELPAFAYRHMVRPGITGWAQVRAPYAADLAETRVKLGHDLFYLKNFSLGLDLQILARTLLALMGGVEAR